MTSNQSDLAKETGTIELAELLDSLRRIGEKTLGEAEDLYEYIVDTVHRLTHSPVAMWRVDEKDRTTATIRAHRGLREEYVRDRVLDLGHSVTGEAIQTAKFIEIVDIQNDPRVSPASMVEASQQGWKSMLVVPLLAVAGRAVGTLSIYSLVQKKFATSEIDLLHVFANQAGAAIQNADSFQMLQRLSDVGQSLTTMQESPEMLKETLERIASTAMEVLAADIVDLYQYQADRDEFVLPPIMVGQRRVPDLVPMQISLDDVVFKIAHTGEKIYASNAQEHPILVGGWETPREGLSKNRFVIREEIVSSAAVPMKVDEEVVGVMFASYRQKRDFDAEAELRERIEVFANHGAIAINNARLTQRLRDRVDEIDLLQQVSAQISTTLELDKVLPLIVQGAMRLTKTESGVVHIVDSSGEKIVDSYGYPDAFNHPSPRISEEGYTRLIVQKKEQQVVADAQVDKRASPEIRDMGIRSFVGTPLKLTGERVVGVLYVNDTSVRSFTEKELSLLSTLADQAAVAVQNILLYEQRAADITALAEVSAAMTTESWKGVSELVVQKARELTRADYSGLWRVHKDLLVLGSMYGTESMEAPELPIDESSINGWVAKTGERYVCYDVDNDPHYQTWRKEVQSSLAVPLKFGDNTIGTLNVESAQPNAFSNHQIELLESLADQAAIAIENTRLYEELRESEIRLSGIVEQSAVPIFVIDAQHVVTHWNTACANLTGVSADQVVGTKKPWLAFYAQERPVMADLVVDNAPEKDVAQHYPDQYRQSAVTEGAYEAEDFFPDFGESGKWLFFTAAPLKDTNEKIIGAIETLQDFTERKQAEQELELLNHTAQVFSSTMDLNAVLSTVLEGVRSQLGVMATSVWLIDPDTGELVCQEATGSQRETVRGWRLKPGKGLVGRVAQSGESLIVSDTRTDERHFKGVDQKTDLELRSILSIPLQVRQNVIGVLQVLDSEAERFSKADLTLLEPLATSAAIVVENAQLFNERAERVTRLERLHTIMSTILAEPSDLDKVLGLVVKSITHIFQEASCGIRLYDSTTGEFTRLFAADALEEEVASYTPRPDGTSRYIIDKWKKPFYAKDTSVTLPDGKPAIRAEIREKGIEAIAYLPLVSERDITGMLYVNWNAPRSFSDNDRQILELFADQAAIAIENARLYERLDYLVNRQVKDLRAVNVVGQDLTASIGLSERQILELIYDQTTPLMDTSDMYIALYEPDPGQPDEYNREQPERSVIHGTVRFGLAVAEGRRVDTEHKEGWGPRKAGHGLTEYVIRTRQPFRPSDVDKAYETIAQDYIAKIPKSWMGVPMMMKDEVLGVVVLRNDEHENIYNKDDQEVLQTIATQSAIALQNTRLVQQLEQRVRELDTLQELAEELDIGTLPDLM